MSEQEFSIWTIDSVLDEINKTDDRMHDRRYAFILGAGASKTSGINTGHELAQRWLDELYSQECLNKNKLTRDQWLVSPESKFDNVTYANAGNFYPTIFERRFYGDPDAGYKALEDAIEGKIPSFGYSLLASIIQETRHKVVITTNFDNLVADALAMQAHQSPLIVAHESLAGFVRPNLRRPLVAKIHRDLFLSPKNDSNGTSEMEAPWKEALVKIFQYYTPIVIGYAGNDGSLMDMLKNLPFGSITGRMIWCCRNPKSLPEKAKSVLNIHRGIVTQVTGFDEFMLQLANKLIPDFIIDKIPDTLERLGKTRADEYRAQIERLTKAPQNIESSTIIHNATKTSRSWWSWQLKIDEELDNERKNTLYQEAISALPRSAELAGNYAIFLSDVRKKYDDAEHYYKKALDLEPDDADFNGNYALFLKNIRQKYDDAEHYYKKALNIEPEHANNNGNYALFLKNVRQKYDDAEHYYKKALDIEPEHANNNGNYALFLSSIRKKYDDAEHYYKKALDIEPDDADFNGNYALFLSDVRKKYDDAEQYYKKALDLEPDDADFNGNYANFLFNVRKKFDDAEHYYKKALNIDPEHATNNENYAGFLYYVRKKYDDAELYYNKALDIDPEHASFNGNYANFLCNVRQKYDDAEHCYKKALNIDPTNVNNIANYSSLLVTLNNPESIQQVNQYAQQAIALSNPNSSQPLAEILLYGIFAHELYSELIKTNFLPQLKDVLKKGYTRGSWDFEQIFTTVLPKLDEKKQAFYRALGDAILDETKVARLDEFSEWTQCKEVDVFAQTEIRQ